MKLREVALQFCPSSVHFGLSIGTEENLQLLDESNFYEGVAFISVTMINKNMLLFVVLEHCYTLV